MSAKAKPGFTQGQKDALLLFASGNTCHRCVHSSVNDDDSFFWAAQSVSGFRAPRSTTIYQFLKLQLIEDTINPGMRWRGSLYKVTDAGKIAAAYESRSGAAQKAEKV